MPAVKSGDEKAADAVAADAPAAEEIGGVHKRGNSSVMPETMELAQRAQTATTDAINKAGTVVGGALGELRNAAANASGASANAPAPDKSGDFSVKESMEVSRSRGAATGATVAGIVNFIIAPFFILFAKRFGAHRCDGGCGTRFLYNYWKCTVCEDFDFCNDCYARHAADPNSKRHDKAHDFKQHINTDAFIRTFATAGFILLVVRWFLRIFF